MKTVLRLLAAALALIGIANATYQVVTTAVGPPEIVILTVQLAFILLMAGILLAAPALLRRP